MLESCLSQMPIICTICFCYLYVHVKYSVFSFNSSVGGMVYENQFIQLSALLPSNILYGLGEHVAPLLLDTKWTRSTLFSRDQGGTPEVHHSMNYNVHCTVYPVN